MDIAFLIGSIFYLLNVSKFASVCSSLILVDYFMLLTLRRVDSVKLNPYKS
ncbi:hypothetical protein Premu_1026 [Hallella multisaccharivorax DSM 17128]|uniref:Uncharacterized protein n=1 Tax=Hallella multisaccharivorax DSM 17128 TaxID=688246 RepID=F8N830_9BACT|nr:hypothetical protein Premu_1026 [Hallella multisaccharivorax DSM 17128]